MNPSLQKKIDACPGLPTLPTVALEVLNLVRAPDADLRKLAHTIEKDPALAGRVLKTVNSTFYARNQKVTTVSGALVVLGLQSVKTLVLGFSLVDGLRRQRTTAGFDHLRYWRHSFHAACAARAVARRAGMLHGEELFLAGLLGGIGMLVLDAVMGADYGAVCAPAATHVELATAERAVLGSDHAEVGGYLAEMWRLPAALVGPIRWHVEPARAPDEAVRRLATVVRLAERCADVFVDAQPAKAIADVRAGVAEVLPVADPPAGVARGSAMLAGAVADELLEEVGRAAAEAAGTFELNIGPEVSFEQILREANQALVELSLLSQQSAADQQAAFVRREQELRRQAATDALTGLANRAEFDRFLTEELAAAAGAGRPLALVMLDVDNFKQVNDEHGHPAGDAVLRRLGALLRGQGGEVGLAARYGGEEMVLILPGADRAAAATAAERLRARIEAGWDESPHDAPPAVTASFGVAAFEPPDGPLATPALLTRAADRALYHAKQTGRNRVKVFSLPTMARAAA